MEHSTEVFVGIDVAKARNAIAVADGERGGEVRFLGEVDASHESMRRLIKRIAAKYDKVHFCYVSADHLVRLSMHSSGSIAHSEQAGRPRKDEPARCGGTCQASARRRTHRGMGT